MKTAVFIDGTGCSWGSGTNIERLADAVDTGAGQEVVYCPGPGTRFGTLILGKVFGNDVGGIVLSCARRLHCSMREHGADELYLFGFSRGAFAARLLADFAARGALSLHPRRMAAAWRSYVAAANDRVSPPQFTMSAVPAIRFLGVFDSVDSVPTIRSAHLEHLPAAAAAARHAVAIDEHRPLFNCIPFAKDPRVEEVFFPGSHSDIGGGYADNREIADLTLRWMAEGASRAGLAFKKGSIPDRAFDPAKAMIHDSSRDASNAFGLPRKFMRRIDPARVHPSAAEIAKVQGRRADG